MDIHHERDSRNGKNAPRNTGSHIPLYHSLEIFVGVRIIDVEADRLEMRELGLTEKSIEFL